MSWSPQQEAALQSVSDWLGRGDSQVFRLFGYAGTGKTTLARHFAEGIEGRVHFAAFTGKAAYVLQSKGCEGATTIHKLIYLPRNKSVARLKDMELKLAELPDIHPDRPALVQAIQEEETNVTRPAFTLNLDSPLRGARLLIVDEVSMVGKAIADDLMSFGCPILVLGDPAQLPPVADDGWFIQEKPDVMLTEIHRQARDNPIIRMATTIRGGQYPPMGAYGDSRIVSETDADTVMACDQLLVGRNLTRQACNRRHRQLLGHANDYPVAGDRLVCLRNNHGEGLLNGSIWTADEVMGYDSSKVEMMISSEMGNDTALVECHAHHFLGKKLDWWEKGEREEFDYGYALTVHKSQGSQWNRVVIIDESAAFRKDRWKWLYTAVTRAAERVDLVRRL